MKINIISSGISLLISALIAYGFFSTQEIIQNKNIIGIGSFLSIGLTLFFAFGANFDSPRTTLNTRVLSSVFFMIVLSSNLIFTLVLFSFVSYFITTGIVVLIYLLILYGIVRAAQ